MTNLSIVSQNEVSKNQVIRSRVAKTQQPDAERLIAGIILDMNTRDLCLKYLKNFKNIYRYPCTEEQRNSTMGKYCGGNNNDDLQVMTDEEKLQAGFESSPSQNSITLTIF